MKDFLKGLVTFCIGVPVFAFCIVIGLLYSIPKSFHLSFTKKWYSGFIYIGLIINSYLSFIGRFLHNTTVDFDILANEHAEWIEDSVTHEDKTPFGVGNVNTISASFGWLIAVFKKHYKVVFKVRWVLNKAFMQKAHCEDSWFYYLDKKDLLKKYFQ